MRLAELVEGYSGGDNPEIKGMTLDSRQVRKGWLFAALPGSKADGRKFIGDAVVNGAVAVLAPPGTDVPEGIAFVAADNPRRMTALLAARFYGLQPQTIAAVTGTNGKTSTVHFTRQLWEALGEKAISLGTLGLRGAGMNKAGSLTTPDPVTLAAELADLAAAGVTHLAMEASSHGLDQFRLDGVRVTAAGFTNLSRDHLDYHSTMEDYLAAKARLFGEILIPGGVAVLNADIDEFAFLKSACDKGRLISYGYQGQDIRLLERMPLPQGQEIAIEVFGGRYDFVLPLVGAFQVMNALCALGLAMAETPEDHRRTENLVSALAALKGAPGRLQLVSGHPAGAAVYVDYAHTPDALENVLGALRPHTQGRLACIIGCGGDRDPGKRPMMGGLAAELADIAVITDDNPRSEDPAAIRAAMIAAARVINERATEIGDRREAIRKTIAGLGAGDVLVIAGKGHERGQIIGGRVEPFDDVEEARKAIEEITS